MPDDPRWSHRAQQETQARQTAQQWADWLVKMRTARNMRPIDLVRAAEAIGQKLTTGQISNWEGARNPASAESARLVAKLLDADPVEALRAAGHDDWADFAAELRDGNIRPQPPSAVDEGLAALRASDLPDHLKRKFEHEYTSLVEPMVQATEAWRRKFSQEVEEALREQAQRSASDPGESDAERA